MKKVTLAALPLAALLFAACGTDTKSCQSSGASVASGTPVPGLCTAAPGQTVDIPVTLCSKCGDSVPGCAEPRVDTAQHVIDLNPTVQQCSEDALCVENGCSLRANRAICHVSIPADAPLGSYRIINAATASGIGALIVGPSSNCSF